MALFDVSKYQVPTGADVDMKLTEKNFDIFITQYESAREKVGHSRVPKMTQSFSQIPSSTTKEFSGDAERFLIEREEFLPEYRELHSIFITGYYAISHPKKPDITDRRRNMFMMRYLNGMSVTDISNRLFFSRDVVIEESRIAFIQFCHAIGLLVQNSETKPLVPIDD
ncbi:ArpU family phage transcriptional regulator [Enterococcus pallens]|uniref:ArpU family phage transcriptional regulator n=1 Tax=Enterococcus pallens ATCC BAA-351 TaxID=1158607 RepID=R2T3K0_9ENTE|nr:ArpU family phage transcriptional regulator [Enterococcus pallens]EOH94819.1 ArpU family phage transcriptional regulator [Enterococcus pallens ATCC BAA-351]EOU14862.1 hypothetical protein I588_04512 [Enterococcus pallens ATCC BAA-351]OJG76235.1 ArpU family phage transcriptional regulator [Enterococcus pallens]